jgi:hypothetical protein
MLNIQWGPMPPEVRAAVRPLLLAHLWLVPAWCRELLVTWKDRHHHDTGGTITASSGSDPQYRYARLALHAPWLDSSRSQRRREIIHELLHIPLAPLIDYHEDAIDRLFADAEESPFRAHLEAGWQERHEGAVQDLAFAVASVPLEAMPPVPFEEEDQRETPDV